MDWESGNVKYIRSAIKLWYVFRYSQKEQIQYTLDEKGNINTTEAASVRHAFTVCHLFIVCVVYLSLSTLFPFSHHSHSPPIASYFPLTLHLSFHYLLSFLSFVYLQSGKLVFHFFGLLFIRRLKKSYCLTSH